MSGTQAAQVIRRGGEQKTKFRKENNNVEPFE